MWFSPTPGAPSDPSARAVERYLGPSPWSGEEPVGAHEPQAFMAIAGGEGGEVGVHFHSVDQFQYFVGGHGRFAGHPVGPGVVHYADHLRPYGPITPEGTGVTFLTLRGTSDHGAFYMPGAQPDLKEKRRTRSTPGRNVSFDLTSIAIPGNRDWAMLVDDPDGLCIGLVEVDAGQTVPPWPGHHEDAYVIVVTGAVDVDGDRRPSASFRYLGPPDGWDADGLAADGLEGIEAAEDHTRLAVLCLPEGSR